MMRFSTHAGSALRYVSDAVGVEMVVFILDASHDRM
jgi:hypothetical protein